MMLIKRCHLQADCPVDMRGSFFMMTSCLIKVLVKFLEEGQI